MMPMIATTISNSMRVKPFAFRIFITHSSNRETRSNVSQRDCRSLDDQH
jgi:hypothetical protein